MPDQAKVMSAVVVCLALIAVALGGSGALADKTVIIQNYYGASPAAPVVIAQPYGVTPFIYGGYSYIPLRSLSDFLGAALLWDSLRGRALLTFDGRQLALTVGSPQVIFAGAPVLLPMAPVIIDRYVYVPTTVVSQVLHLPVVYDHRHRHVKINHGGRWGAFVVDPTPAPHFVRQVRVTNSGRGGHSAVRQVSTGSTGHGHSSAKSAKSHGEKHGKGHGRDKGHGKGK